MTDASSTAKAASPSTAQGGRVRRSLTEGPVGMSLARLTLPMVWGVFAVLSMTVVDTYWVGKLGTIELAAMTFCFPVAFTITSLGIGLSAGTSSVISRVYGAGDRTRLRRLAMDAVTLSFIIVAIVSAIGLLTIDPLFRMLGAGDALMPHIRDYMTIYYWGTAFIMVPMVGNSVLRGMGDMFWPSLIMTIIAVSNFVLDPILIFGWFGAPALGVGGAALATVINNLVGLILSFYLLAFRERVLDLGLPRWSEVLASWREILRVGAPTAVTNSIVPVAQAVLARFLSVYGAVAVAGYGVATRIEAIAMIAPLALSGTIGPFVGQNMGAGKPDRVRRAILLAILFCLGYGACVAALLALFGNPVSAAFTDNPETVGTSALYLWMVPLSYGAYGMGICVAAAFNALGNPRPNAIIVSVRLLVLYLPLAWLGSRLYGVPGIFAAGAISNVGAGLLAWWFYKRRISIIGRASE